jgi:hypothetical protein
MTGTRDNLLGSVTHLRPRGPLAYGSGLTGVRRGTLGKAKHGRNVLVVQKYGEQGRHGSWSKNVSLGTLIPITGVIGIMASFPVTYPTPFKAQIKGRARS